MRRYWLGADITIEDVAGGVVVRQRGLAYKARGFRVTDRLVEIIDLSVAKGIDCIVRPVGRGHPTSDKWLGGANFDAGSHSLPFSREPTERWIYALDKPPQNNLIVFEKNWRHFMGSTGASWTWEVAGGRNVFVPFEEFRKLLDCIDDQQIDLVKAQTLSRRPIRPALSNTGVTSEAHLQQIVVDEYRALIEIPLRRVHMEFRNEFGRADVVFEGRQGEVVVAELKKGFVGESVLEQISNYLSSKAVNAICRNTAPEGAVIAGGFDPSVLQLIGTRDHKIGLYTYRYAIESDNLKLEFIGGAPVLGGSQVR